MSAQVKPGYKQTEIGVIPEDWAINRISEIGQIKTGPFGTLLKAHEYVKSDGVPLISVGEIGDGQFRITTHTPLIPREVVKRLPQYVLKEGDVVFGRKGAVDRSVLVTAKETGWFLGSDGISLRPKRVHPSYIAWQFRTKQVKSWLQQNAVGTTMASLNQAVLNNVCIALAPLHEQEAIAIALGDIEALLNSLDQLIAKKRNIQQAAMQQLLTGQRRLPGFSEEWQKMLLGELAFFLKGSSLSKIDITPEGAKKCILYGELFTTYGRVIQVVHSKTDATYGTPSVAGDVLLPGSTTTTGIDLASASALVEDDILLGGDINIIRQRQRDSFSPEFLARYLTSVAASDIAERAQGITIIHLYGRDLKSLLINLPPKAEQVAITSILSDMDTELSTLEARRDKALQLKQGMMQELLTGRIRLA